MATTAMSYMTDAQSSSVLLSSSYDGMRSDISFDGGPTDMSEETARIFLWINFGTLGQMIALFGIIANVINIICFYRQGFAESFNISLLGLAISDLGCLITVTVSNVAITPAFQDADLPIDGIALHSGGCAWVYVALTRITSCLTAFITLERCLCITVPLKVKNIFTPKRVTIIITCIFITHLSSIAPMHYVNRLGWIFSPERNRTIIGLVFTEDRLIVEKYYYSIINVFVPFVAFVIITGCTVILVVQLRSKAQWRLKSAANESVQNVSQRDQRVAKMAVMISVLFISCFVPLCFLFVAMTIEPEVSVDGKYKLLMKAIGSFMVVLQSVNSAANIFIYYKMSIRYREMFWRLFGRARQ